MKKLLVGLAVVIVLGVILFFPGSGCQQPVGGFPVPCNLFEALVMGLL
ncbi:YdgA family protein [Zhengella mangrovi]|nr:YdgA family protein [Zhengella mangrovi]